MPSYLLKQPHFQYRFNLLLAITSRYDFPARHLVTGNTIYRVTKGYLSAYRMVHDGIIVDTPTSANITDHQKTSQNIFGLGRDLTEFYDFAQSDDTLWSIIKPLYGLPIYCTESIFEALITLIIEQHISWKNALRAQQTLMEIFQTHQEADDIVVYDFPTPQQIASSSLEQLKPLKITHRRINLMIDIARQVESGELDLDGIRLMNMSQAYTSLMQIKGVGHWTANNVLGRALGYFPHISHNDVALQAAVLHYFHADEGKKSAQQTIDTLEPYGEYAGLVGHFTLLRWVLDRYPVVH